ncbi:MAG: DUF1049 domain-containing protein [Parvibaculaceae bacterium]
MKRALSWAVGLPIALLLIGFAVANRSFVDVSFDPFSSDAPWASISAPLWALLFFGIFCGLLVGWCGAWLNQGKWRRASRGALTELTALRAENTRLRRERDSREVSVARHDETLIGEP